jgi:hypothetical protein
MQNLFKLSKLNGYCTYRQMGDLKTFCQKSSCMYVLYMSQNKQRLWLYTALTALLTEMENVYRAVRTGFLKNRIMFRLKGY